MLLSIKDDLQKEEGRGSKVVATQGLEQAIQQARVLWAQASKGQDTTEERLIQIEVSLEKLVKGPLAAKAAPGLTWAKVAAQQATCIVNASILQQATVCICIEGTKDKSTGEILAEAKKIIPGVYAVWLLHSRDIDIVVPDQATKDCILNQPGVEGCKILQQDYLIEVL
jgi:hypothetical protein